MLLFRETWERKALVIECVPFPKHHTAENLADELMTVLHELQAAENVHLIVRDNATNIVNATALMGFSSTGCFLHGLHLAVTNSLSSQRVVTDLIAKAS